MRRIGEQAGYDRFARISADLVRQNKACQLAYFAQFGSENVPVTARNPTGKRLTEVGKLAAKTWLLMPESGGIQSNTKILKIRADYLKGLATRARSGSWLEKELSENVRKSGLAESKRDLIRATEALLRAYQTKPFIPPTEKYKGWKAPSGWKPVVCPPMAKSLAEIKGLDPDQAGKIDTIPTASLPGIQELTQPVSDLKWIVLGGVALVLLWGTK